MAMRPLPIHVHRFQGGALEIQVPAICESKFIELVQRATNLWPDAPPEIKAFADQITNNGVLMQDYSQAAVTEQPQQPAPPV